MYAVELSRVWSNCLNKWFLCLSIRITLLLLGLEKEPYWVSRRMLPWVVVFSSSLLITDMFMELRDLLNILFFCCWSQMSICYGIGTYLCVESIDFVDFLQSIMVCTTVPFWLSVSSSKCGCGLSILMCKGIILLAFLLIDTGVMW